MIIKIYTCDRCRAETKYPIHLTSKPMALKRDLCPHCLESLKAFLNGKTDPHQETVLRFDTKELQEVYVKGAEALEMWANGATADQLAQQIRDMLSRAKREADGKPRTLLGVTV